MVFDLLVLVYLVQSCADYTLTYFTVTKSFLVWYVLMLTLLGCMVHRMAIFHNYIISYAVAAPGRQGSQVISRLLRS